MLRFGLLICVCLFFLGCALLFAFGSAGSPCFDLSPILHSEIAFRLLQLLLRNH